MSSKVPTIGMEIESTIFKMNGDRASEVFIPFIKIGAHCKIPDCKDHKYNHSDDGPHTGSCVQGCQPTRERWGYVGDTQAEFTTPWHTDMESFSKDWIKYWIEWFKVNPESTPVFRGQDSTWGTIGQHHHLGLLDGFLGLDDRTNIAKLIDSFSPLMTAIYANAPKSDSKSSRMDGFYATQCYPDAKFLFHSIVEKGRILTPMRGHADSDTMEIRGWDANYPQVALTIFEIEMVLMKQGLQNDLGQMKIKDTLKNELWKAIKYGFNSDGINPKPYIEALEILGLDTKKEPINSVLALAMKGMNLRDYLTKCKITTFEKEAKIAKELILNPTVPPENILLNNKE